MLAVAPFSLGLTRAVDCSTDLLLSRSARGNTSTIISTLITVCKGRQKRHELIFLLGCQSEATDCRI